jgi:hypothetical protein
MYRQAIILCLLCAAAASAQATRPAAPVRAAEQQQPGKLVWVVDASGSMLPVFAETREQVKQAVGSLAANQHFNVIAYRGDEAMPFMLGGLLVASPDNKEKFNDWMDGVTPNQDSNPVPAIRTAFENKPEVIYLLLDGVDKPERADELSTVIRELNKNQRAVIHCVLIVHKDDDKDTQALQEKLQKITTEHRGVLRIVQAKEFVGQKK